MTSEIRVAPFDGRTSGPFMPQASRWELADLHHLLPLQGFDLPGPTLAVAVAVTELAVVTVPPAEHLAALGERHGVAVAAA